MLWEFLHELKELNRNLSNLNRIGERAMSEITDLQQAVRDVTAAVSSAASELSTIAAALKALAGQAVIDPAAVEAAAVSLEAQAKALNDSVAAAQATIPTPPMPPVTPLAATVDPQGNITNH